MNCGAEGATSLLCDVESWQVMDAPESEDGHVLVHVTACRLHTRPVKAWLTAKAPPGVEPAVVGTEYLMRHWGQIVEPIELPVFGMVAAG